MRGTFRAIKVLQTIVWAGVCITWWVRRSRNISLPLTALIGRCMMEQNSMRNKMHPDHKNSLANLNLASCLQFVCGSLTVYHMLVVPKL